jgi:integrase
MSMKKYISSRAAASTSDNETRRLNDEFLQGSLRMSTKTQYDISVEYYEELNGMIGPENLVTGEKLVSFIRVLTDSKKLKSDTIGKYATAVKTTALLRTRRTIDDQEEVIVNKALRAAANALSEIENQAPKRAIPLPEEAMTALSTMNLVFGSEKDILRSSAIVAVVMTLRLDQVWKMSVGDITSISTVEGLVTKVVFKMTKTALREDRETLCSDGIGCTKLFCTAHYLKKVSQRDDKNGKAFPGLNKSTFAARFRSFLNTEFPFKRVEWQVDQLTGHSFRHTSATMLKRRGVEADDIKAAGNWRSDAWRSYADSATSERVRRHGELLLTPKPAKPIGKSLMESSA